MKEDLKDGMFYKASISRGKRNDEVETLYSNLDREMETELDNLVLLKVKKKEFCLKCRVVSEVLNEDIREQFIKILGNFLDWEKEDMEIFKSLYIKSIE